MTAKGAWTPQKVRERIKTSMLIHRLTEHALGSVEMPTSAVSAALGLLRKSIPDLAAVQHSGTVGISDVRELSSEALASELIETRAALTGTDSEERGETDSRGVH